MIGFFFISETFLKSYFNTAPLLLCSGLSLTGQSKLRAELAAFQTNAKARTNVQAKATKLQAKLCKSVKLVNRK